MTKFKVLGLAVILSAAAATPVLAEQMISEPGLYAFYHPNGDLGLGASRPADALAQVPSGGSHVAGMRMQVRSHTIVKRH